MKCKCYQKGYQQGSADVAHSMHEAYLKGFAAGAEEQQSLYEKDYAMVKELAANLKQVRQQAFEDGYERGFSRWHEGVASNAMKVRTLKYREPEERITMV